MVMLLFGRCDLSVASSDWTNGGGASGKTDVRPPTSHPALAQHELEPIKLSAYTRAGILRHACSEGRSQHVETLPVPSARNYRR
jgi:hypothetical protein